MKPDSASYFFEDLLVQTKGKPLSSRAKREHQTIRALFRDARGQNLATAKETLWGAVNAVTYYVDHVRGSAGDRLDSAWFGAGYLLKEKAWARANALVS